MSIFLDASALVAIITEEEEGETLMRQLFGGVTLLCSPISEWEAVVAVGRKQGITTAMAEASFQTFMATFNVAMVPIDAEVAADALAAHGRYGKGSGHPARLNMGDCFAYACAKANDARLLYKGDDFARTDLAWAAA